MPPGLAEASLQLLLSNLRAGACAMYHDGGTDHDNYDNDGATSLCNDCPSCSTTRSTSGDQAADRGLFAHHRTFADGLSDAWTCTSQQVERTASHFHPDAEHVRLV